MTSQEGGGGKPRHNCHHLSVRICHLLGMCAKVFNTKYKDKVRKPGSLLSTLTAGDHSLATELAQILFLKMSRSSLAWVEECCLQHALEINSPRLFQTSESFSEMRTPHRDFSVTITLFFSLSGFSSCSRGSVAERSWDGSLTCPALPFSLLVIQGIKAAGYKATDGDFIHSLCSEIWLWGIYPLLLLWPSVCCMQISVWGRRGMPMGLGQCHHCGNTVLIAYPHYARKKKPKQHVAKVRALNI